MDTERRGVCHALYLALALALALARHGRLRRAAKRSFWNTDVTLVHYVAPDGRGLVINNYGGCDYSTCLVVAVSPYERRSAP